MNSFKVRDGIVTIQGVTYSQSTSESNIRGKAGRIHSINIEGRGQFFPIGGVFNDGTTPIVNDEPSVKKRAKATKMVEESGQPLDSNGHLIGKKKRAKK